MAGPRGLDGLAGLRDLAAPCTVDGVLQAARSAGVARLDALLLLAHATGQSRTALIAHGEQPLSPQARDRLQALLQRRAEGVPMAYLLGRREFHGLVLRITPEVLDPRPDTEVLVDWALERMGAPLGSVVDLGTGSGAIALALKAARPLWAVQATDASSAALAVARGNARDLGLDLLTSEGRWWEPLAGQRFHLAVSNPPYIAQDDPHLAALRHEPLTALTSGPDGLQDLRAIIAGAADHLHPGGWLLLEHGHDQAQAVAGLLRDAGFQAIDHRQDLAGHTRCTGGRLAG